MSGFSSVWLGVRERHDGAARSGPVVAGLIKKLSDHLAGIGRGRVRVLDLGSGTGSNLRHFAPKLPVDQDWTLVDSDGQLLSRVEQYCKKWRNQTGWIVQTEGPKLTLSKDGQEVSVRCRQADLRDINGLDLADYDLVTGSALLDLVSVDWMAELVVALGEAGCRAVYFALSADERLGWQPILIEDRQMADLFHRDLSRDKGFGPAAGVAAPGCLARLLEAAEYDVWQAESDWVAGPTDMALLRAMIGFVSDAARMQAPRQGAMIRAWQARRRIHLRRGNLRMKVGHKEVLALK